MVGSNIADTSAYKNVTTIKSTQLGFCPYTPSGVSYHFVDVKKPEPFMSKEIALGKAMAAGTPTDKLDQVIRNLMTKGTFTWIFGAAVLGFTAWGISKLSAPKQQWDA